MTFPVINFIRTCFRFTVVTELLSVWSFRMICTSLLCACCCQEQVLALNSNSTADVRRGHLQLLIHILTHFLIPPRTVRPFIHKQHLKFDEVVLSVMSPLSFVLHVFRVIQHTEVKWLSLRDLVRTWSYRFGANQLAAWTCCYILEASYLLVMCK